MRGSTHFLQGLSGCESKTEHGGMRQALPSAILMIGAVAGYKLDSIGQNTTKQSALTFVQSPLPQRAPTQSHLVSPKEGAVGRHIRQQH
jgi:hypothetical protein